MGITLKAEMYVVSRDGRIFTTGDWMRTNRMKIKDLEGKVWTVGKMDKLVPLFIQMGDVFEVQKAGLGYLTVFEVFYRLNYKRYDVRLVKQGGSYMTVPLEQVQNFLLRFRL